MQVTETVFFPFLGVQPPVRSRIHSHLEMDDAPSVLHTVVCLFFRPLGKPREHFSLLKWVTLSNTTARMPNGHLMNAG